MFYGTINEEKNFQGDLTYNFHKRLNMNKCNILKHLKGILKGFQGGKMQLVGRPCYMEICGSTDRAGSRPWGRRRRYRSPPRRAYSGGSIRIAPWSCGSCRWGKPAFRSMRTRSPAPGIRWRERWIGRSCRGRRARLRSFWGTRGRRCGPFRWTRRFRGFRSFQWSLPCSRRSRCTRPRRIRGSSWWSESWRGFKVWTGLTRFKTITGFTRLQGCIGLSWSKPIKCQINVSVICNHIHWKDVDESQRSWSWKVWLNLTRSPYLRVFK